MNHNITAIKSYLEERLVMLHGRRTGYLSDVNYFFRQK